MLTEEWLRLAEKLLSAAGVSTARLDALVLLEDATGKDRAWLLSHPEHELQRSELELLSKKCVQRCAHIPLAYIRGKTEFYGRDFVVNEHVLEPRPESEVIIDMLKSLSLPGETTIGDIGTGSGALAVTAALELPTAHLYAVDIDHKCLRVAKHNAEKHHAIVRFAHSNLLEALKDTNLDVLLCNLPYVPDDFHINTAATHEPKLAIFGGNDGLDHYRTLFAQADSRAQKPQYIIAESLPPQHRHLLDIAARHNYKLEKTDDFIQLYIRAV